MASGDTLLNFTPYMNEAPAANYATYDTRNQRPVLDFDATVNEYALTSSIMPRNYSGGGITAYITLSMSSAVANTVDFDLAFERVQPGVTDIDIDNFAAVQSIDNTTVPGDNANIFVVIITFTDGAQMDNVQVGELYRIKINRDAVNDDAAGDAELHGVELKET